jgi:hypothetical protein
MYKKKAAVFLSCLIRASLLILILLIVPLTVNGMANVTTSHAGQELKSVIDYALNHGQEIKPKKSNYGRCRKNRSSYILIIIKEIFVPK